MASSLEGAYKSLLQGVSQQVPRLRLDGQVSTQENMLADPVTSLRRRPGAPLTVIHSLGTITDTNLYTQYVERGSDGRTLIINTSTGNWWVMNKDATAVLKSGQDAYFIASGGSSSLQSTSVGGETFILNIQQAPQAIASTTKRDPSTTGWYFTKVGAFDKDYTLTIQRGGTTQTFTYHTPSSTDANAVAQTSPVYITSQLVQQMQAAGIEVHQQDMYIYVVGAATLVVTSTSGTSYVGYSGRHNVALITDLPAVIPAGGDGILTSVGTDANALTWYRWEQASNSWVEDSSYGSPAALRNMPRVLAADDTITAPDFEGRLAGDDLTNEIPTFLDQGVITGMTTYQGRLVLLSGAFLTMSKSGNPYRFYRSTVTELQNSDRIDIGIGSSQNSILRRGIQFNRDLVLFGDAVQAVVSGGGNILTPSTAAISLTSEESCVSKIAPMQAGQTVLYPFKRSSGYSGMLELIPSQYTSSQYVSQDATGHIPEYFAGDVRVTAASNVVNMCVFTGSRDTSVIYVHEYQWSSDGKVQAAWHRWTMPQPVVSLHFAREKLVIFTADGGNVMLTVIDAREGYDNQTTSELPYLDLYTQVAVSGGQFVVPSQLRTPYTNGKQLGLAFATGTAATEEAGISSVNTNSWTGTVELGVPDGTYWVGIKYMSKFTPTPPILKDENGKEIGAGHVRLVRMEVAVRNTGMFNANVKDVRTDVDTTGDYTGLFMNSPELVPDYPLIISQANVIVPCRTLADTTEVTFSTNGTHDMNLLDISYLLRYNQRRRRV
ncbi:putative tail tubular protein B [Pantoea phage LIMElight]|uniref:Putative tail tubular protein B n=1 Tax=Pantoea phage LIMElight TaxID=881915 RepID=E1Y3V0_9CAUD|nr:tail protein [Pantoea phage LIMElight]CBW54802.1 putative tail tubular protein B [Pantoea phage LIMElight]